MAQFLSTSELDFDTLKENLKTFLKSQNLFKDYDFEGSNISVLLDLLTYNTYQNAFYLNQVGSEMFLDTALLKESVSSHAKELNYLPRSRGSSSATVNLTVTSDPEKGTTIVPRFTTFETEIGSNSLIFSTDTDIVARNDGTGVFVANNVTLYEGTLVTEFFEEDGTTNKVVLSSANVDVNSIDVTVQTSSTDISNTTFDRALNLFGLTPTSTVFFVQPYGTNRYELEFGNDVTGKSLDVGNIVRVRYRDVIGRDGDNATSFISTNPNISTTTTKRSTGGSERESIESIKFNAPRVFATQDRAVTVEDYKSIVKTQFPFVQTLNVIGGEKLEPPRYGKVLLVGKPFGGQVLSQTQKDAIVGYLSDKASITSEVITGDADFLNIIINTNVQYNSTQTTLTDQQVSDLVLSTITNYNDTQLSEFDQDFRYSKLSSLIDAVDSSVISNDTKVSLAKRISPVRGRAETTTINYGQRIRGESDYGVPAITSSRFIRTINNINYEVFLRSRDIVSGVGAATIDLYTETGSGIELIIRDVGFVNFDTGIVILDNFVVSDYFARGNIAYGDHINVIARPYERDIIAERDQILLIDSQDISINVTAKLTDD